MLQLAVILTAFRRTNIWICTAIFKHPMSILPSDRPPSLEEYSSYMPRVRS